MSHNNENLAPEDSPSFFPEVVFGEDEDIIDTFAEYFGIDRKYIISHSRKHELVYIRDLIVHVLREHAEMSFPAIGKILGGRDHTTIIHSYRKLKDKFESDVELRGQLVQLVLKAKAIKNRKTYIEEKMFPDLIASIKQKHLESNLFLKPVMIPERNIKLLELYREGLTLQEIGNTLGLTRERARQIVEKTLRQSALNESLARGIELNTDIILEDERKKRVAIKQRDKKAAPPKPVKEKMWSRYYIGCKECGTTTTPHRRKGLCQKCIREYGPALRDVIITQHSSVCDICNISRPDAVREYGRDFYITKTQQVICRKCFLETTGKLLGTRIRK